MIIDDEIIKVDDEAILVLKLDCSYEFDVFNKHNNEAILLQVKYYLKTLPLDNYYNKILLTVSGLVVASLLYINGNYRFMHDIKTELPIIEVLSCVKDNILNGQESMKVIIKIILWKNLKMIVIYQQELWKIWMKM